MIKEDIKLAPPNKVYSIQESVQSASDFLLAEFSITDNLDTLDYHYAQAIANLLKAREQIDSLLAYVTNGYRITEEEYNK